MRKFKSFEQIPSSSEEYFIPLSIINQSLFTTIGIKIGGVSTFRKGSIVSRIDNRDFHIFIMTLSGKGKFVMEDGLSFVLEPGQCFFSSAKGQGHKHSPLTEEWKLCWLQIDKNSSWFISLPDDYSINKISKVKEIQNCFEAIISESMEGGKDYSRIEELQCELLLYYIKREIDLTNYSGKNLGYMKRFTELWKEVSSNISAPWDVPALCAFMGLSKAHLVRLCEEFYKISPAKKIIEYKMNHAYTLLSRFDYRVSDVAYAVGYNSTSSFTYAFKNYFGILPKEAKLLDLYKKQD